MKLAEAYVDITARTGKFMRALSGVKRSLGNIMRVAAKMALALVAAFAAVTFVAWKFAKVAMVQERAEKMLDATLRTTGQSVKKYGKLLRDAASEIQKTTIFGDEFLLGVMAQGLNLGITADKIVDVTKSAIGLSTALQMDLNTSMRMAALATLGETTMLRRYIPALRQAKDMTEQMAIVQKVANAGFKQAQEEINNTLGAIEQLKNMLGDMAEVIGKGFLKPIRKVTKFLLDNTEAIKDFVDKAIIKFEHLAKTLKNFWDNTDFTAKLQSTMKAALLILKGFFDAAIILATATGKAIGEEIRKGLTGGAVDWVAAALAQMTAQFEAVARAELEAQRQGRRATTEERMAAIEGVPSKEVFRDVISQQTMGAIMGPAWEKATAVMAKSWGAAIATMGDAMTAEGKAAQRILDLQKAGELAALELNKLRKQFSATAAWFKRITAPKTKDKPVYTFNVTASTFSDLFKWISRGFSAVMKKLFPTVEETKGKKKERERPGFVGLENIWRQMHLGAVGMESPEVIQKKQLEEIKKQTVTLKEMKTDWKKTWEFLKKLLTMPPSPAPLGSGG